MSESSVADSLWLGAEAGDCQWANWDDTLVLLHRPSGKTHFVNQATGLLLQRVLLQPRTAPAAARELAQAQGVAGDADFVGLVAGLLSRLEELGLARRVSAA